MHGNDGLSARRDERLDRLRIDIERARAGIGEDRFRAQTRNAAGGCEKGKRRANDLVAGADAESHQRDQDGIRAGGHPDGEPRPDNRGRGRFERLHFAPHDELAGMQNAAERVGEFGLEWILTAHIQQGNVHSGVMK